jgi:hypothetical protein
MFENALRIPLRHELHECALCTLHTPTSSWIYTYKCSGHNRKKSSESKVELHQSTTRFSKTAMCDSYERCLAD